MTGGVRVIGEGHKIFNNYFYHLVGEDVFAALPIMNGVPDSPLNRYFQVKSAQISFNTFVDCKYNIVIGTGADEELCLPPINSVVANNIFYNTEENIVTLIDEPQNFLWEGNIYHNAQLGIESNGFSEIDPLISQFTDGLFRISENSPAIGNAVGNYKYVTHDMDGQQRKTSKDIGCDQYSTDPVIYKPLKATDIGPNWLQNFSEILY
jgi:poly(beta-D-mannuronate) lyase